jgi:hypothetical protein
VFANDKHFSKAFEISSVCFTLHSQASVMLTTTENTRQRNVARNFARYFVITSCVLLREGMYFTFISVSVVGIIFRPGNITGSDYFKSEIASSFPIKCKFKFSAIVRMKLCKAVATFSGMF